MSDKRKIASKLVQQRLVCCDKVALAVNSQSAIKSVIDWMFMFYCPLKSSFGQSFSGDQRKRHREQVSINKIPFIHSQFLAKYNPLPERTGDFQQQDVGSNKVHFIIEKLLKKKIRRDAVRLRQEPLYDDTGVDDINQG